MKSGEGGGGVNIGEEKKYDENVCLKDDGKMKKKK